MCLKFSGFNVDEVDTFYIINCELPTIPFNLILHRTSVSNNKERGSNRQISSSSQSSVVRSLSVKTFRSTAISLQHFQTLFFGLDSLESLSIENYQLVVKEDVKREFKRSVARTEVNYTLSTINYSIAEKLTTETSAQQTVTVETTAANTNHESKKSEAKFNKLENSAKISNNATSDRNHAPDFASPRFFSNDNNLKKNSANNTTKIVDPIDEESSFPHSVHHPKLNLTFGQLFPKLKSLILRAFLTHDSDENSYILKELLTDLRNLEYVFLNSNVIRIIPSRFLEHSAQTLKNAYFIGNKIRKVYSFASLKVLESLDISQNEISQLSSHIFSRLVNLKHVRISQNHFKTIPNGLFAKNVELTSIDMNLNEGLKELPSTLLLNLERLENFSIADCNLTRLAARPEIFFSFAPNLKKIDMRNNRFKNLTAPKMFARNPKLSILDISFNDIESISKEIFDQNNTDLVELNFYGNNIRFLDQDTFFYLKNLKILNFGFNNLHEVKPQLFYNLANLVEINLSKNKLVSVNSEGSKTPFGAGKSLKKIDLSANYLSNFKEFTIQWNIYLHIEKLNLTANRIQGEIEIPVFHSIASELVLDLRQNNITSVNIRDLEEYENTVLEASKLEKNDFNENRNNKLSQLIVILDNNPLHCDCNLHPLLRYAKTLNDRTTRGVLKRALFDIHSPDLTCATPARMSKRLFAEIGFEELTCDVNDSSLCPQRCHCFYRPEDKTVVINGEGRELTTIPIKAATLTNIKGLRLSANSKVSKTNGIVLNLAHNSIKSLDALSNLLRSNSSSNGRKNFMFLDVYLDHNKITKIPETFLMNSSHSHIKLRVLSLRYNHITQIPANFLRDFTDYINDTEAPMKNVKLYLGSNPYRCVSESNNSSESDCDIRMFKSWLVTNYLIVDSNNVKCDSLEFNSSSALIHIPDKVLCPHLFKESRALVTTLVIIIGILAVFLFLVTVLYYRNKQTILAFIYIHLHPVFVCFNFTEEDIDEDKLYDAFVSYSSADRDIVMQLIEKLEKPSTAADSTISFLQSQVNLPSIHEGESDQIVPDLNRDILEKPQASKAGQESQQSANSGPEYFKLCIHERDWLPGNLISWNIVNSVQNSRRTILVLSKEFIKSIWFRVEFHTAYYQMLEDKIDRLIVIVKGELPPKEELDKDLVFLLTTKTYLVWGEKWFWEKLRYALPHKKRKPDKLVPGEAMNIGGTLGPQHKNKASSKNEIMKEYVEQAIANHFQLKNSDNLNERNEKNKNSNTNSRVYDRKSFTTGGVVNDSFVIETET
ncbi:Toll-like protein [Dinothrombium tinctorium]|uniref:Toll-like protein n=1 Tax=Dinothrombium tinctorium TaxID=1965070 RepID=A0A3S3PRJ4_9ACAR|nr:Toll-like protein [Dinothrombium tinctorium]RWS15561.1 Toll-like protein [Dinothrombium tinctorium]